MPTAGLTVSLGPTFKLECPVSQLTVDPRALAECGCACHEPGAAITHFDACCGGECPTCGRAFVFLDLHHQAAHGGPPPRPRGGPATVSRRRQKKGRSQ